VALQPQHRRGGHGEHRRREHREANVVEDPVAEAPLLQRRRCGFGATLAGAEQEPAATGGQEIARQDDQKQRQAVGPEGRLRPQRPDPQEVVRRLECGRQDCDVQRGG
jgi:hypothetical protein